MYRNDRTQSVISQERYTRKTKSTCFAFNSETCRPCRVVMLWSMMKLAHNSEQALWAGESTNLVVVEEKGEMVTM